MERNRLTEATKNYYALGFIENRILEVCTSCVDSGVINDSAASKLLDALLHREQLLAEMKEGSK